MNSLLNSTPVSKISSAQPPTDLKRTNTFFIAFRYGNHAGPSGYDKFAEYLGEKVAVSPLMTAMGNSVLRLPAKLVSWNCGSYEYSRHDAIQELATRFHMGRHRDSLYHFLYAEKSLRFLGRYNRWRGHRIVGSFHHCAFKYPLYFRSTKHFEPIEHAVVVSTEQLEHMEKILGHGRVTMVPYAVDCNYFTPRTGPKSHDRLRCTCVGQHLRDYDRLEQIIPIVRNAVPQSEFHIIGANRCFDRLQNLEGVTYKRGISDVEYLDILRNTDLLVLPLTGSTSVTTVNEALACGVPVVTDRGGISDYLTDDCSVQVASNSAQEMADIVIQLLRSEQQRCLMGEAARRQGLTLDWSESARKMQNVYSQLA